MQVADIRERLDHAKTQEGTSKIDSLKASFNQKKAEGERAKAKAQDKEPSGKFSLTLEPDQKLVNWSARDSMVEKIAHHQEGATKTGSKEWEVSLRSLFFSSMNDDIDSSFVLFLA